MDNQIKFSNLPGCGIRASGVSNAVNYRRWSQSALSNAMSRLEIEFAGNGQEVLLTELLPTLFIDESLSSCQESASRLGMTTGGVMSAVQEIRARFKILIREEFSRTVSDRHAYRPAAAAVCPM